MSCRVSHRGAHVWPAAAVEVAAQDRVSGLEHEITRLRAQLASERALSDGLRERVALLEDQAGGYQVALAEVVVERDELRAEVEELRAALSAATDDWTAEHERAERLAVEREQALAALGEATVERDAAQRDVELWHEAAIQWMRAVGQLQAELETALRRERADDAAQARALRTIDEEAQS